VVVSSFLLLTNCEASPDLGAVSFEGRRGCNPVCGY
jgi:hypothetical protein